MKIIFQGGTLVLYGDITHSPPPFQWIKERWRCEAYHYPGLADWFEASGIQDAIPDWQQLDLTIQDDRTPHDYQTEAIQAWDETGREAVLCCQPGPARRLLLSALSSR